MYVNTNMAGTQIVCSIYKIYFGGAQPDLVASWLGWQTLELANQGRFLGGHLLYIIFSA